MDSRGKIHKNTLLRAQCIAALATPYYEEGNQARCWRAVWRRYVYPVYPMCYNTFMKYMRISRMSEVSDTSNGAQLLICFD